MKTALVTGGAGFIGSHIADRLISEQYRVIIVDNLSTGKRNNIPDKAQFIQSDIRNKDELKRIFDQYRFDVIFHIAGQASISSSFTDPYSNIDVNYTGTVNLVLLSLEYKIPRFLFASSMTVYGQSDHAPIPELQPCIPISYYGITKYAAECFVLATGSRLDLRYPFNATSFRMFNVYGPRQSLTNPYQGALAIFIGNVMRHEPVIIYGDGKQTRDFIYIDDIVDVWIRSINDKKTYGQIINVGFGKEISINTLVRQVIETFSLDPAEYAIHHKSERPGAQRYITADIHLLQKLLSITPKIDLDEGLTKTIAWARSQAQYSRN